MKQTLYLMLGYPGAGKTTVALLVSKQTGAVHLWADHERKESYGEPTYSQQENDELYNKLNAKAEALLKQCNSVMYDTAFNHYEDRLKLRAIADKHGARTVILWIQTPKKLAKHRATVEAHLQPTRVLNGTTPMHHEHFEYLSDKLEEPREDENFVSIDGTKVTEAYIRQKLNSIA